VIRLPTNAKQLPPARFYDDGRLVHEVNPWRHHSGEAKKLGSLQTRLFTSLRSVLAAPPDAGQQDTYSYAAWNVDEVPDCMDVHRLDFSETSKHANDLCPGIEWSTNLPSLFAEYSARFRDVRRSSCWVHHKSWTNRFGCGFSVLGSDSGRCVARIKVLNYLSAKLPQSDLSSQ
jgi:hypothetical protein